MQYFIAAVVAADWLKLGAGLDRVFACGITGIDVRIAYPSSAPRKDETELVRLVQQAGLVARIHAWAGAMGPDGVSIANAQNGARQGRQMAEWAERLGVTDLASGNFEKAVWAGRQEGKRKLANPNAVAFIEAYAEAFRARNPHCRVGDLGFADPRLFYSAADANSDGQNDNVLPSATVRRFDRKCAMAYQSTAGALRKKLALARNVAGADVPLSAWTGVGRIDPEAGIVGSADATRAICRERASGIDEWTGYVPPGAIGQVLVGHPNHISLVELVPLLIADQLDLVA